VTTRGLKNRENRVARGTLTRRQVLFLVLALGVSGAWRFICLICRFASLRSQDAVACLTPPQAVQATKTNLAIGNDSSNPQGSTAVLRSDLIQANYYQSAAFGLALYATSSIFYRFTGSIFNPSVSLALTICGVVRPVRFFRKCAMSPPRAILDI
jgi:hypothetical protein